MARHCRRRTRGEQETIRLIESLFLNAEYLTDFLGTPLLKEDAFEIWQEEQCHVKCLQDPVNVMLYTQTGTISKGGISLQVYRCARGTTSLESFHAHHVNFIPLDIIGHLGQEATKRCFVSGGSPSLPPSKSRVVEAICVQLMNEITSPTRKSNKDSEYVSRYGRVVQRYNEIKHYVSQSTVLMERTGITLFQINESTLSTW